MLGKINSARKDHCYNDLKYVCIFIDYTECEKVTYKELCM